jgi:hypothetical protein
VNTIKLLVCGDKSSIEFGKNGSLRFYSDMFADKFYEELQIEEGNQLVGFAVALD